MYSPVASPQDPSPTCLELISASRHQRVCFEYFPTPENIFSFLRPVWGMSIVNSQYLKNCGILILCFLKVNSQVNKFTISLLLGPFNLTSTITSVSTTETNSPVYLLHKPSQSRGFLQQLGEFCWVREVRNGEDRLRREDNVEPVPLE